MRSIIRFTAAALCFAPCLASPPTASAVIISVSGTATGGFGDLNSGFTNMVLGKSVTIGGNVLEETVRISATGLIDIGTGPIVPPNGISISQGPTNYPPLEEKIVDAGGTLSTRIVTNFGAVMYAFVPAAVANNGLFVPRDEDITTLGIDADILFFVGAGPLDVTVNQSGVFYIGVNDSFASNNSGNFTVTLDTISQLTVPEPSSGILLGLGFVALIYRRRGRAVRAGS